MEKIFVQIPSYRDPDLLSTIRDCIDKASFPDRLIFGICWQHDDSDTWDNIDEFKNNPQFKILDFDISESHGVCWARSQINKLYDNEKYTLQIDSHHRFANHWDEICIEMLGQCDSEKPILSGYLPFWDPEKDKLQDFLFTMKPKVAGYRIGCATANLPEHMRDKPMESGLMSGCFVFTHGTWINEVPYDKELYFWGEEMSMSIRSWTRGYDIFVPNKFVCWHRYGRSGCKRHWHDHECWAKLDTNAKNKVKRLMFGEDVSEPYGCGTVRTLQQFENLIGASFKNCHIAKATHHSCVLPKMEGERWKKGELRNYKINLNWDSISNDICTENPDLIVLWVNGTSGERIYKEDLLGEYLTGDATSKTIEFKSIESPNKFILWCCNTSPFRWGRQFNIIANAECYLDSLPSPEQKYHAKYGDSVHPQCAVIRPELDFTFIHIPKNGGVSFIKGLGKLAGQNWSRSHTSIIAHINRFGRHEIEKRHPIAFIRDPIDRLKSAYFFGKGLPEGTPEHLSGLFVADTFEKFCDQLTLDEVNRELVILRPQVHYVCGEDGELLVECFPFEKMPEIFKDLAIRNFGRSIPLPHINATVYDDFGISDKTESKIRRLYPEDFDLYYNLIGRDVELERDGICPPKGNQQSLNSIEPQNS